MSMQECVAKRKCKFLANYVKLCQIYIFLSLLSLISIFCICHALVNKVVCVCVYIIIVVQHRQKKTA